MGGASLYVYLYAVCGGAVALLGGLAGVLWFFGRRRNPRGRTTKIEKEESISHEEVDSDR